jgi:glycosyltransferase involved in cell wall biosynthesis
VAGLAEKLEESAIIYHCVDDYAEFSGVKGESLRRSERELMKVADLVFVSSKQLWRERVKFNPRTYFVPHGVDLTHFSRALNPHLAVPGDIVNVRPPIIGFFGLVADWVDLDVVADVARARPDWSFVLIGRCITDTKVVTKLPNVLLLGQRPYESLPAYCRAFDVGIIPFRVNNLTVRANPLKLREYLAAGLPVVSTPLPEVTKYAEVVRVAEKSEEFVREIEQALKEREEPFVRTRLAAMKRESWESRVEEFSRVIDEYISPRRLPPKG